MSETAGRDPAEDFEEDAAAKSDDTAPGPGAGHNSAARAKAIDEALQDFYELQKKEDALLLKHIEPIRKKKAKIKADLKSEYEIPTKSFNARAALYIIERDDEPEIVLAVNEMFAATPVGHNIDLVELAARVKQKAEEKAAKKSAAKNEEVAT